MKRRGWWSVALLACMAAVTGAAWAQGVGAVRKQVEASMRVTGEITVDSAGKVADYTIDQPEKLPAGVLKFVQDNIAAWEFNPPTQEGQAVAVRNTMSILLVAKRLADENFLMRMQAASFSPKKTDEGYTVASKDMTPPRYPTAAARGGASGTVYLIVKVGRDGRVQDVVPEQVNLRVVASENVMDRLRKMFADASVAAARKWEFTPPSRGEEAQEDYWSVRVPVDFFLDHRAPQYGRWSSYIPGPRQKAPWVEDDLANDSPEALAAGTPHLLGQDGLRLRTPLAAEG